MIAGTGDYTEIQPELLLGGLLSAQVSIRGFALAASIRPLCVGTETVYQWCDCKRVPMCMANHVSGAVLGQTEPDASAGDAGCVWSVRNAPKGEWTIALHFARTDNA